MENNVFLIATHNMKKRDELYRILIALVKVIASVDYDTIALNKQEQEGGPAKDKIDYLRTICGVFLDGKAVCKENTLFTVELEADKELTFEIK